MYLINTMMSKRMLSLWNKSMDVNRVFISVKRNNLYGSIGVGILTSDCNDIFSEKIMCLRFLERDDLLLHQLCSLIYVYQKCNLRKNDKKNIILMDPLIEYDRINVENISYMNTVYKLLYNRQMRMERSRPIYYQQAICNRLSYFASDINNTQGIDDSIKLCTGEKIGVKFLFSE